MHEGVREGLEAALDEGLECYCCHTSKELISAAREARAQGRTTAAVSLYYCALTVIETNQGIDSCAYTCADAEVAVLEKRPP